MPYRFSRERVDYSDFASGRVFRSVPGRTAFPVRLADELFQRCLALRPADKRAAPVVLYDPCCGGASLLCTLALLHWPSIGQIVASDADPEAIALAGRNLALLTSEGIAARRQEIAALHGEFGKESHAEALGSTERLAARIDELAKIHPLPTRRFLADALDPVSLREHLEPRSIDVVIADIPHGLRSHWLQPEAEHDAIVDRDQITPNWLLLEALWPALAPDAVLAIVGDKAQRARHERYAPASTLQIGKRRATFLTVRSTAPVVTLIPSTPQERHAFTETQIAEDAAWLVDRGEVPDLEAGLARARAEIEREMAATRDSGDLFWTAHDAGGATVGWLWVQTAPPGLPPGLPPGAAYLCQILVRPEVRRRGHGLAMMVALEEALARRGASEIHLHTFTTNLPGQRLYDRAGYDLVEQLPAKIHLRKRLTPVGDAPG